MADTTVPYLTAHGNLSKALERIKTAQTPPRFTQDFLETKLNLKGGSARPVIPFLKRTGFLAPDGTPTERYKRFRGSAAQSGAAAAEALREGYAPLYAVNEYVHDAADPDFKGIVVQVTGAEPSSSTVQAIIGSFKALKAFANFDALPDDEEGLEAAPAPSEVLARPAAAGGIKLGYTINLNLPATSDIAVFDSIFKSLRANLLT
jgi:hypothetical protein